MVMCLAALAAAAATTTACESPPACFSPTVGKEITPHPNDPWESWPPGCPCDPARDMPVCVLTPKGLTAFWCTDGKWSVGFDGPCRPPVDR